jgi:hypothetical protein
MRWVAVGCSLVALGLFAACGGSDDDSGDSATTGPASGAVPASATAAATPEDAPDDDGEGPGGGEEGTATVTADGVETSLGVDDCTLAAGALIIVATNAADGASLSVGGIASVATITFNREGEQWIAAGAPVTVNGSTITYEGTALKAGASPPDTEISMEVVCAS